MQLHLPVSENKIINERKSVSWLKWDHWMLSKQAAVLLFNYELATRNVPQSGWMGVGRNIYISTRSYSDRFYDRAPRRKQQQQQNNSSIDL